MTVNGQPRYRAVWTYEVTIVDDDVVESDETLVLQMSRQATLPAIHTLGGGVGPVQATVTIVDDDAAVVPEVTIAADQAAFTAALDDVTFTLTRTEDPAAALDVAVALTQDGTLLASADLAQTVTFGAGEATATLEIASHRFASHTVTEEEATLTATVQDGTGYEPGSPNTASTRIVVADPAVTASFEQAAYTFDEAGGDATVAVILRTATGVPSPNRQIFFSISTKAISGEAVMGDDYVHQSGVFLSVLPSDFTPDGADFTARKEVTLVIVDDAIHEPDETLNMLLEPGPSTSELVAFRQPDGTACPGSGCEATVTIVDNDDSTDATLSGLAVNDGSMDLLTFVPGTTTYTATVANDVETVTFTETKNDAGASVAYLDSDDNPIADADTAAGHQVPLDVGANVITVRVTAEDGSATLDYTVMVTRGEPPPTVTVVAAAGGETVTEGTDAAFTLSRTGATAAALTVTVAVSQTGSVLKDASAVPSSVTFDAGAATATLELATNDDNTDNDDGTVTVTLGTGTGYTVGDPGAATVAVSDNDVPVDFVLSVPATVAEDAGPATVTVTATTAENAPPATAVAVQLAGVGGTATGGSDYDAVSATAVFQVSDFAAVTVGGQPRYQAVWTYDVMILDDEVVEGDETVVLEMSPTPGFLPIHTLGGVGLDAVRATVTIVDDDVPVVTIAADKSTVIEDSGAAGFTLSRTGPTEASLTVTVAVTQEVDRDLLPDGAAAERTVTFAVGSATAALSVTLKNDDLHDVTGDLTVEVRAGMGYTVGDPASATLSVIDVDTGLPKPANLMASAGAAAGEVALSWDAYAPYLVFVRHQYRYKTDGDYPETWIDIPNSGQHATGAGDGSNQTGYTVTGLVGGQLHTFQVRTYTSSSSASDPSDEAMATPRSAVVSFGAGSYSVDEGGTVEVTVQLDAAPGREVVVPVSATGEGGATAPGETGADWSGVPQNVTFGATDTARTFTLAATQDTVDDDGESVALSFGTLPDGVTAGSPSEATVTITDDDAAAGACTLNTDDIWCGVVTVGTGSDGVGFVGTTDPLTGALTDNSGDQTITIGSDGYAVSSLLVLTNQPVGALAISLDKFFPDSDEATLEFYTRSNTFKVIEATQFARGSGYYWENSGLSWSAGDEVTLRLRQAGATNNAPAFTSSETFNPAENQTTVGTVEASDDDMDDEITGYVLSGGADQTLFSIGSTSGVLTFQAAPDYEDPQDADTDNAYEVTVQVTGGTEGRVLTATQTITVTVMNVAEQPDTPAKPTVTAVSGATDSLAVTWSEPDLNGGPAITGYGVEYRVGATGTWTDWSHSGTDTTTTITGLTANTDYQVQVRALNGETPSAWSDPSDAVRTTAEMTPVVTIAPDKSTVSEEAGAAGFTLSRTEPTAERTVTFAAGSTTATLTVTLDDDDLAETSGALTVQVQEGDGYTVGTPSSAAVTITDGDTGTLPPAGLAASAGPRAGEVVLAWDAVAPWLEFRGHQYRYKTDGGYESWTDIPDSGPRQPNGIGWSVRGLAAGQVHTFQVRAYETPAVGDPVYGGASDEALATPLAGQVTLHLSGVNNNSALENAGPVTVTATVAPASATAFTVTVTASPVAPAMDADFELSTNQELSFAADATDSTGTVTIGLVDDDVAEPNDVVTVSGAVSDAAITAPADVTLTIANDDHDVGYDIAVVAPATVDEDAGTASVTVTLTTTQNSAPTTAPFLLYWPKPETATPDADYTRPPEVGGVVTTVAVAAFSQNAAGTAYEAQATFMIGIVDDSLDEADETIVFEVRTASDESPAHTITITDNDDPPVVSFGARSYSVDEGGTVEVTVQLESAPGREVVVPVSAAGAGGATPPGETGADWSGVPESVTFGATDTAQTFTLAATDDTDVDPGESVALSFGTLPAGVTAGTPSEASVTIVDNDMLPELSVEDAEATEASPVTFTVALSPAAAENVTVDWAASVETGDTATSGTDFTAASDTLTFMPGDTTATFTVQTTDDTVDEDDETFTVTLSSPSSSATLATDPTATGTIKDDDAVPALVIGHGSAREDSAVAFTVSLTPASGRTVTVIWAVNLSGGQTAELADFPGNSLQNGSVTFMPGQTTAQIQVSVVDDELDEGDETFEVNLAQARNARLEDNTATGTIVDNDDAPNAAPTAADQTVTTAEDTAHAFGASDFGFADTDAADELASVRVVTVPGKGTLAVSGSAVSVDQEVAVSDLGGNLTFTPAANEHGSGYASFTFRVSDGTDESASAYTMTIDVTAVNDAPSAGTVTIDDTAPVVGDELTATAVGIADPDGLPAPLLLSWQWYRAPAGGSETEIAGATAATYRVREDDAGAALTAKATYQDSGGFANTLASAPTGAVGRSPVLSVGDASETEGQTVTFTVRLTAESGREVTVDWAASAESGDTAGSGDFTAVTATTLTFTAGQTEKTVTVSTTEDTTDEYDETFTLTLSDATNATLAADATATGTIRDDDDPPGVRVTDASASEGEDVKFEVTLTAASGKTVNLSWELSVNNVPAEAADFASFPQDGVMTFGAGDTKKTIAVATAEDTTDEDDETFEVRILPDSSVDLLGSLTATGTIEDDDDPPTLGVANVSAIEGSDVTFTVRLSAESGREVTVDWAASAESGDTAGSGDFTAANGGLTFTAGQTEKMVTVSTTEDTTDEENETFTLRLSNASNATLPDPATATATIDDDDGAPVLNVGNASATEGRAVSFEVTLTVASTQPVTVDAATAVEGGDTAVSGTDFTAVRTALTFTVGQTEKTVTVSTTGDTLDEENETFTLRLSNATNATLATNPTARGTIDDDDPEPSLSVDPASAAEGQAVTFTVRLTAASGKQVMVDWAASVESGDTAGSGDFTTVSAARLTFTAGQTEKTVTVSTSEDTTDEENETFTLRLSNASNATLATDPTATGTIDDDDGAPVLSVGDASATEGQAVTFRVRLTAASGRQVTVDWAASAESGDTAGSGDFTAVSATTLTFRAGQTEKTVTVSTTEDTLDEENETFTLRLSNATNATLGTDPTATGTIDDDDGAPNAAPTAADRTVTTDEDTAYAFDASDFDFADADTGDELASVRVVTLPGSGTLAVSGSAVSAGQEVAASDLGGDLTFTPAADEHGSGYASFTFRVSDGSAESASDYTMTIDVTPVNDAPSAGTVSIDDTAPMVGDELTASTAEVGRPGRPPRPVRAHLAVVPHAGGRRRGRDLRGGVGDLHGGRGRPRRGAHREGELDRRRRIREHAGERAHERGDRGRQRHAAGAERGGCRGDRGQPCDLHADAVDPVVERDAGSGPDGDGHDQRRRRGAGAGHRPWVGERGLRGGVHGIADAGERQDGDGVLGRELERSDGGTGGLPR